MVALDIMDRVPSKTRESRILINVQLSNHNRLFLLGCSVFQDVHVGVGVFSEPEVFRVRATRILPLGGG